MGHALDLHTICPQPFALFLYNDTSMKTLMTSIDVLFMLHLMAEPADCWVATKSCKDINARRFRIYCHEAAYHSFRDD